ncbi:FtsX-like permease family protein [Sorangium sp. So ce291]|uniref:FtsX-like permease family protein n=1 Tax=Sorangium sp. So ce291 TaxID=3133294 RepID=UPI003F5DBD1B
MDNTVRLVGRRREAGDAPEPSALLPITTSAPSAGSTRRATPRAAARTTTGCRTRTICTIRRTRGLRPDRGGVAGAQPAALGERTRGSTPRRLWQVRRMVLMEGAPGAALAVLLGIPLGSAALGALRTVSTFEVEPSIPPEYGLFTALGANAVALFASLYPARSAGRSNAAESVHYE